VPYFPGRGEFGDDSLRRRAPSGFRGSAPPDPGTTAASAGVTRWHRHPPPWPGRVPRGLRAQPGKSVRNRLPGPLRAGGFGCQYGSATDRVARNSPAGRIPAANRSPARRTVSSERAHAVPGASGRNFAPARRGGSSRPGEGAAWKMTWPGGAAAWTSGRYSTNASGADFVGENVPGWHQDRPARGVLLLHPLQVDRGAGPRRAEPFLRAPVDLSPRTFAIVPPGEDRHLPRRREPSPRSPFP